jgi:hypothetical protein
MKRILFLLVALFALAFAALAQAQDALVYGEPVIGTFEADTEEVEFAFDGVAGDIVLAQVYTIDASSDANAVNVRVLDANGDVIAEDVADRDYSESRVIVELPEDGTYTLVAYKDDGYEDMEGEFTASVTALETLEAGQTIELNITNETYNQYVVLSADGGAAVSFEFVATDDTPYVPSYHVATIDENGNIINYANGSLATLGSTVTFNVATDEGLLLVAYVSFDPINFMFDTIDQTAAITLEG